MGLVLTVAVSKTSYIPVIITTPEGKEIIIEVEFCKKRSNHINMRINAPKEYEIQRGEKTHDKTYYRAKREKQSKLLSCLTRDELGLE